MNSNKGINEEPILSDIYGPPPIQPILYGPPLSGPPPRKNSSCFMVSLIVGALIGGIITWLLGDCSISIDQPTVYGPPPVDTTLTVPPVNNE